MNISKYLIPLIIFCSGSIQAHHSFQATFKSDAKISVEGTVTAFSLRNPHVIVRMEVTNDDGSVTNWMAEGPAANILRRGGWARDSLKPGDLVRVNGDSTHDGSPMVSIDTIDMLDPQTREVTKTFDQNQARRLIRQAGEGDNAIKKAAPMPLNLADGRPNLTGTWTNHGIRGARPRPPVLALNELGQQTQERFDNANDPQIFCDPPGLVRQIVTPHPYKIAQYDDHVVFEYEEYAQRREVYLTAEANSEGEKSHFGDSVARYEGNTLIVETTNLIANPSGPNGYWLSDQTTTVEIYRRNDSDEYGPMVNLELKISDPVFLAEEGSYLRDKMSAGSYEFTENDCHPPLREREIFSPQI